MHDERITWTTCPRCGDRAALGWRITTGRDGAVREDPVSFDCNVGCTPTDLQFLYWFSSPVREPGARLTNRAVPPRPPRPTAGPRGPHRERAFVETLDR